MPNANYPTGLHPVKMRDGQAPFTMHWPLRQQIQATTPYTTAIFKGQIVIMSATGPWLKGNGSTNPGTGGAIIGVAAEYYKASDTSKNRLAVWDARNHIFAIQSDNATTTSKFTDVLQKNCSVANAAAGSTVTGLSTMELDFSTAHTTTTKPLRVIDANRVIGESTTGAKLKLLVEFNFGHVYQQNSSSPW